MPLAKIRVDGRVPITCSSKKLGLVKGLFNGDNFAILGFMGSKMSMAAVAEQMAIEA